MTSAGPDSDAAAALDAAVASLAGAGIGRVHVLAWRDLDDPDGGGSEVHADEVMRRWAARGLDVLHRTSAAQNRTATAERNGYRVVRRGGRYSVFPRAVASELLGRMGPYDALVEVWNGVPWLSPIWCRRPSITIVHHVHREMWAQILPGPVAAAGRLVETRLAPRWYRRGLTVTPSTATRGELIELGFRPGRVVAVPNGVGAAFSPGGERSAHPSLIAVGRLAPVKRFDRLITAAAEARRYVPDLTLTIVGEGPDRSALEQRIGSLGAHGWVSLPGRLPRAELVDHYRRAWLAVSASLAEGWGLSLTEAAACGTASVATDIAGHGASVVDGETGVLAPVGRLGQAIAALLRDDRRRHGLERAALARAASLTWDATALGVTRALVSEVDRRRMRVDR